MYFTCSVAPELNTCNHVPYRVVARFLILPLILNQWDLTMSIFNSCSWQHLHVDWPEAGLSAILRCAVSIGRSPTRSKQLACENSILILLKWLSRTVIRKCPVTGEMRDLVLLKFWSQRVLVDVHAVFDIFGKISAYKHLLPSCLAMTHKVFNIYRHFVYIY